MGDNREIHKDKCSFKIKHFYLSPLFLLDICCCFFLGYFTEAKFDLLYNLHILESA